MVVDSFLSSLFQCSLKKQRARRDDSGVKRNGYSPGGPRFNSQPTCLLTAVCNSGRKGPDVLFSSLQGVRHTCGGAQTCTQGNHLYTQNSMLINSTKIQFIHWICMRPNYPLSGPSHSVNLLLLSNNFSSPLMSLVSQDMCFSQLGRVQFQCKRVMWLRSDFSTPRQSLRQKLLSSRVDVGKWKGISETQGLVECSRSVDIVPLIVIQIFLTGSW